MKGVHQVYTFLPRFAYQYICIVYQVATRVQYCGNKLKPHGARLIIPANLINSDMIRIQLFGAAIVSAIAGLTTAINLDIPATPGQREGIANVL